MNDFVESVKDFRDLVEVMIILCFEVLLKLSRILNHSEFIQGGFSSLWWLDIIDRWCERFIRWLIIFTTDFLLDSVDEPDRDLEFGKLIIRKFFKSLLIIIPIVTESEINRKIRMIEGLEVIKGLIELDRNPFEEIEEVIGFELLRFHERLKLVYLKNSQIAQNLMQTVSYIFL